MSSLSVIWLIRTNLQGKGKKKTILAKIWAKGESGLTTVWLKWDPSVSVCVLCSVICLFFQLDFTVLQFTLSSSSVSTSGMSSSAYPPPGTTKNLHGFCLFIIFTLHTPNWRMHWLLYVCNMTFSFVCCANLTTDVLGTIL